MRTETALKIWVGQQSLYAVAKEVGCSPECLARYAAGMTVRGGTRKLIEQALATRESGEAPRSVVTPQ